MNNTFYLISFLIFLSCCQTHKSEEQSVVKKQEPDKKLVNELNKNLDSIEESNSIDKEIQKPNTDNPCDSTKCDINIVLSVFENQENLIIEIVEEFLMTFSNCCSNNVEFSEFSNEMLFAVLIKRPDLFLSSYKNKIYQLDTAYINLELQSPLHDLIPLKEIIAKIDSVKFDNKIKEIVKINLVKGR